MIGHSKGAENAIICGQTLNHLVDITISSSNHFCGFLNDFTYRGTKQNNAVKADLMSGWNGFEKNEGQESTDPAANDNLTFKMYGIGSVDLL